MKVIAAQRHSSTRGRPLAVWLTTVFVGAAAALLVIGPSNSLAMHTVGPVAHTARTLSVLDRTYLHLVGSPGVEITENGTSYGTFSGNASSHLTLSGSHITGTFVFHTRGGLVRGTTRASVVGKAALPVVSFAGTVTMTSGTGSYRHISGQVALKGSIRRKNYEVYEETSGKVHV
jgi:hypothetical protein